MDDNYIGFEIDSQTRSCRCQHCDHEIYRMKGYRLTYPSIGRINDKIVVLKLRSKIYYCRFCEKTTLETIIDKQKHAQKSDEFISLILNELKEMTTYSCVARKYKISPSNVIYHFDRLKVTPYDYTKTKNISIDELRLVKGLGAYQCIITDNDTNQIIDILPNRLFETVKCYLSEKFNDLQTAVIDCWAELPFGTTDEF